MLILIGIFIIVIIIMSLRSTNSYSDERLMAISRNLKEKTFFIHDFPRPIVKTKKEFTNNWAIIINNIYHYDQLGESYIVNQWCYFAVKYYTRYVIKYGNQLQRKALTNFAKLMEINGFVN